MVLAPRSGTRWTTPICALRAHVVRPLVHQRTSRPERALLSPVGPASANSKGDGTQGEITGGWPIVGQRSNVKDRYISLPSR